MGPVARAHGAEARRQRQRGSLHRWPSTAPTIRGNETCVQPPSRATAHATRVPGPRAPASAEVTVTVRSSGTGCCKMTSAVACITAANRVNSRLRGALRAHDRRHGGVMPQQRWRLDPRAPRLRLHLLRRHLHPVNRRCAPGGWAVAAGPARGQRSDDVRLPDPAHRGHRRHPAALRYRRRDRARVEGSRSSDSRR